MSKMPRPREGLRRAPRNSEEEEDEEAGVGNKSGATVKTKGKGSLEGHFKKGKDINTLIQEIVSDVDTKNPRVFTYMDAINKAFREYLSYQDDTAPSSPVEDEEDSQSDAMDKLDLEIKRIQEMAAGRLRRKRSLEAQRVRAALGKGEESCSRSFEETVKKPRVYPEVCHPENVWLEFAPKKADWHAMGTAWSDTSSLPEFTTMKTGNRKLNAPGWLVDLSSAQIQAVQKIKEYLSSIRQKNDFEQVVDDLYPHLAELGVPDITLPEITRDLRYCPDEKDGGLDYRVFLLAVGDFGYASQRNAIRPYPRKFNVRDNQEDTAIKDKPSKFDEEVKEIFEEDKNDMDALYTVDESPQRELVEEPPPFPIRNHGEYVPTRERKAMFEWRQRIHAHRKKLLLEQSKWAEAKQAERMVKVNKQREQYMKDYNEKKKREAEERRVKEKKKQELLKTKQALTEQLISEGILPLTAAKKAAQQVKMQESKGAEEERRKDGNVYSARQQIAWTGLFLGEMFDSMDLISELATKRGAAIPHKVAPRDERGYKQWRLDQIEKNATASSPYLQPLAFVSSRIEKEFPKGCRERGKECKSKGTMKIKFDHWILDLPQGGEGRILVTENRYRIRQILDYVFFKSGSTLCLLPRVELMLHFAHNLTDQIFGRPSVDSGACVDKQNPGGGGGGGCGKPGQSKVGNSKSVSPDGMVGTEVPQTAETSNGTRKGQQQQQQQQQQQHQHQQQQQQQQQQGVQMGGRSGVQGKSPGSNPQGGGQGGPEKRKTSGSSWWSTKQSEGSAVLLARTAGGSTPISSDGSPKPGEEEEGDEESACAHHPRGTTPFRNPAVIGDECNQPQGTIRRICTTKVYPPKNLPERPKGNENLWIRKYADSLFLTSNVGALRPKESVLPYRHLVPVRKKMANLHSEEWDGYSCRRYHFRQELWDKLHQQDFNSTLQRDRFSAAFWALLPPDIRQPRALLNTNVERALSGL